MTKGDKTTQHTFQYILGFSPTIMTTSPQKSSNPAEQTPVKMTTSVHGVLERHFPSGKVVQQENQVIFFPRWKK